jgi:hypothetical protein
MYLDLLNTSRCRFGSWWSILLVLVWHKEYGESINPWQGPHWMNEWTNERIFFDLCQDRTTHSLNWYSSFFAMSVCYQPCTMRCMHDGTMHGNFSNALRWSLILFYSPLLLCHVVTTTAATMAGTSKKRGHIQQNIKRQAKPSQEV